MSETGPGPSPEPMSDKEKLETLKNEESAAHAARMQEELADKYDSVPGKSGSEQYEAGGYHRPLSEIRDDISERQTMIEGTEARVRDDIADKTIPVGDEVDPADYEHLNPNA